MLDHTVPYLQLLSDYCDARRAAGWKVIVCTEIAEFVASNQPFYDNWTSFLEAFNAPVRNFPPAHADAVADFALTLLGVRGSTSDPSLFPETIHPSAYGQSLLVAPMTAAIAAALAPAPQQPGYHYTVFTM
jgi:hypothetical protein